MTDLELAAARTEYGRVPGGISPDCPADIPLATAGIRALIRCAGEDPDSPGLIDTPSRVLRAMREMTAGNPARAMTPAELLSKVFVDAGHTDQMVAVGPIAFASLCEHHLLPFTGHAWIAYLPVDGRVVGLSKLPRLLDHFAAALQIQERLTQQVVDALAEHLLPLGAACLIEATHDCMAVRGVRKTGAIMRTTALTGPFLEEPATRAEFLYFVDTNRP